jgi:hypothetical protein
MSELRSHTQESEPYDHYEASESPQSVNDFATQLVPLLKCKTDAELTKLFPSISAAQFALLRKALKIEPSP